MVNPWIKWLLDFLMEEIPAAVDGKPGGTLSEWIWDTFNSNFKRIILFLFLASLTAHLVFKFTVIPIIVFGVGMAVIIGRKHMNYGSWLQAAVFAGIVGVVGSMPLVISDGSLSGGEMWLLATGFFGALFGWMKTHPPVDKDGDIYGAPNYDHDEKK